jgi:hypothetical protein
VRTLSSSEVIYKLFVKSGSLSWILMAICRLGFFKLIAIGFRQVPLPEMLEIAQSSS